MVMRWKLVSNVTNDEYHKYIYKQLSCLQDIVEQLKCCQQGMLSTRDVDTKRDKHAVVTMGYRYIAGHLPLQQYQ